MESVRSFERGLAVIRSFGQRPPAQTLAEVARATGLSRAVVRRLLHTLANEGYVQGEGARFELTPRVLDLGQAYLSSHTLPQVARPHLRALSAAVLESVSMAVLDGTAVVYLARIPVNRVMPLAIGIGTRFEAYRTALGQALLAWRAREEVAMIWENSDHSHPMSKTPRTFGDLWRKLDDVRRLGYALVDQELEVGVRSVAAPILAEDGPPAAAINVSTHVSRRTLQQLQSEAVPRLLKAAAAISTDLATQHLPPGEAS